MGNQPVEQLIANLNQVPEKLRTAVQNNGGGHANHSAFWLMIGKGKGGKPSGKLAEAIDRDIGGFEKFTETFTKDAMGRFGSGGHGSISQELRGVYGRQHGEPGQPADEKGTRLFWESTFGNMPTT